MKVLDKTLMTIIYTNPHERAEGWKESSILIQSILQQVAVWYIQ